MKNKIAYTERNGIYYPNLAFPEQTCYPLGKYANLRLDFMKKHRQGTYTTLLTEARLNEYLHEIDLQAHAMLDDMNSSPRTRTRHRRRSEGLQRASMGCQDEQYQGGRGGDYSSGGGLPMKSIIQEL